MNNVLSLLKILQRSNNLLTSDCTSAVTIPNVARLVIFTHENIPSTQAAQIQHIYLSALQANSRQQMLPKSLPRLKSCGWRKLDGSMNNCTHLWSGGVEGYALLFWMPKWPGQTAASHLCGCLNPKNATYIQAGFLFLSTYLTIYVHRALHSGIVKTWLEVAICEFRYSHKPPNLVV